MPHDPRLTRELRHLLHGQRVAALGTLSADGTPAVSMVPFALDAVGACLVIHVSGLAAHTRQMLATPRVSLMVMQAEVAGEPVHALPRVTLDGEAVPLTPGQGGHASARAAYLARFPEAEPMTQLGDFRFFTIRLLGGRHVAGFGAARSVDREELESLMAPAAPG